MDFKIATVQSENLDMDRLKSLFASCKWDWLEPDKDMTTAFEGSYQRYIVTSDNQYIGFARIVSDGKVYGLLVDCMVSPEFRRRGIGKALVDFVASDCRDRGIKIIQLLASNEGLPLYQKAGFTKCPEASPGMIKFLMQPR